MIEVNTIYNTNCLDGLKNLPDNSIDCCVTSPPYYGLRDYGTAKWEGGNSDCNHLVKCDGYAACIKQMTNKGSMRTAKHICPICGAIRIDDQIGLEDTPEIYIEKLAVVFSEVYRALKPSGSLWLNIGDSYWGGKGYSGGSAGKYQYERRKKGKTITPECSNIGGKGIIKPTDRKHEYIKPKDLIGIPFMLAFELRKQGFYWRNTIIWNKPNPMPESVIDRCTKSHEYIFLLTKSANYYYDCDSIREPNQSIDDLNRRLKNGNSEWKTKKAADNSQYAISGTNRSRAELYNPLGRNKRDVWTVCTKAEKEAHFAVFPDTLIVDCIKAGCPENGIVLDPFMGSGTTAVVARKLNRNYVGFELNPDYVKIANNKIYKELGIFK